MVIRNANGILSLFRAAGDTYQFLKLGDSYGRMLSLMPWIVKIFPGLSGYDNLKKAVSGQHNFMKKLIDEQYRTFDENHDRHFLDLYFKEMKAKERNKNFRHADFDCTKYE